MIVRESAGTPRRSAFTPAAPTQAVASATAW